ncbi:hypothetical protein A3D00_00815 [Candidatus Woesebacteria bacterium RIFCSPHIGHO2_02_FULL_38_9]|uniref:Beta-lactamase class A catalytic domain-containing protein n=1 Tax=Candidatus Woesebacteria bacterium RIFCSPHIGHO2_01_FULL_39_28 TaxID=1802496 RepID=A0A1F7YA19_9BACT|nr:MAG: hypothetical protein A2627_02140 [Candidatus Woesebacteria bacterium RIFCSPHIGHO2_01_FULL_39_28]OGM33443.1 MAG: hypothetical protein A3D00_00815 [Candidatus Woesebacteria bacterium RIFCSPHIGHO2_02_FULL_38_9]OGM57269.1 MAG: hypothetical protein A3A50_00615 [Candidatus Woesebacteria bacterium RIFCSPLOWO2_01_FULL_38_20]
MSLFRRKKEEENYEYEEELPARKKFRDLKPENKRMRREPPKAWGKKERLFVLFIFLTTIIISAVLAASARSWKLPGVPKITIPIIKNEQIVIEKEDKNKIKNQQEAGKVILEFKNITNKLSGLYGFYVVNLESGFSYGVFQDEVMQAASLIKLPVFATLYQEAESGNINLETKYTLKNSDKLGGSGSLASKPEGTVFTYRELARLMGKQSDNTAFNIFRKVLGDDKIDKVIEKIEMKNTSLAENLTSPADIGTYFGKLWNGKIVGSKSKDEILSYLTDTIYEDIIPKGVPEEVVVAHKFGRDLHIINDAGIILTDKPFVLVVMSQGIIEKEAEIALPQIVKTAYDAHLF